MISNFLTAWRSRYSLFCFFTSSEEESDNDPLSSGLGGAFDGSVDIMALKVIANERNWGDKQATSGAWLNMAELL